MKKLFLICLINVVLMASTGFSAEAKHTVGLLSSAIPATISQSSLKSVGSELSKKAGVTIGIRSFDSEATLENWLLRFQELDVAIVSASFLKKQPAGTLSHLADLHLSKKQKSPLALVARQNSSSSLQWQIKKAFLDLYSSPSGASTYNKIGIAGVTAPGKKLVKKLAPKTPVAKPAPAPAQEVVAKKKKATVVKPASGAKTTPSIEPQVKKEDIVKEQVTEAKLEKPQKPLAQKTKPEPAAEMKPLSEVAGESKKEVTETAGGEPSAKPVSVQDETKKDLKEAAKAPAKKEPVAKETPSEKTSNKRVTLFIALLILAAIIIKGILFALKWQSKPRAPRPLQQTTSVDESVVTKLQVEPEEKPADESSLIIEEGALGPGKVPELLKRCADMPKPVALQVNKDGSEKIIYFAGGQVSGAYTQNAQAEKSVRWNKLGSLLIREKLITNEERDQGMALITKEPNLRFGEALLKLNLLNLNGLRHALTRQAKVTIYSLILFPEGQYQIIDETSALPPEESVALEVNSLIREASHHQSEWTAIRQTLPNLNKKLEFTESGKEKVTKVNLAPQQSATLALIDGEKTINDLCLESSMLDYEVYRFLYLMVKTGVLQ